MIGSNDRKNQNKHEIQQELARMRSRLVTSKSKKYFDKLVKQYKDNPAQALAIFKQEDKRSDIDPRIRQIRDQNDLGPNIEGSPTVAILIPNIPGISNQYHGISGRFGKKVASNLRLGAVTPTHAEGRVLAKLAQDMKVANLIGGRATLYVDKPPCGFCRVVLPSIKKQYDVDLNVISP